MSKIRVLYFYPYLNFDTGSPKAMVQFIDTLDRSMFEPVYCALGEGPLPSVLAAHGVEIVAAETAPVNVCSPFAAIRAIARHRAALRSWKIDLLHANCFPWNTDLILAAWSLKIPIILHVHNAAEVGFQNLVRFAARKVLFCSASAMHNCGHVARVAAKSEVLYNLIDTHRMASGKPIRERLGITDGQVAIGTVAQLVHGKGIDIIMDAARALLRERSDLVFLIAGPLAEREQEFGVRMMAMAEEEPLRGHVRFLGSRSDIPDFLASLDLFILPTRHETLGIAVLEAMAAGLPVIASKVGGIPEILSSPEIGKLAAEITPEAFIAEIRQVLSLPDRGRSMGVQARRSLTGRFDIATGGERLARIYLDVVRTARKVPKAVEYAH